MKKIQFRAAFTIALLILILSGCAPKSFTIQLHLKPNTSYHLKNHIHQHFVQEFMGKKQAVSQDMDIDYTWKVTQVDEDGTATIEITYDRVAISQKQGGQEFTYDSAKDKKPPQQFMGINLLVGKKFEIVITPTGTVKAINGLDEMFKQIEEQAGVQGKQKEILHKSLTQTMGADTLQGQFGVMFGPYTDKPLQKGSTWENDLTVKSFFPVTVHSTYTVLEWKDHKATIGVKSSLASDPNQEYKLPLFTAKYNIKGSQTGTLVIDLTDGMPISSSVKQHMEGTIHLLDPSGSESIPLPVTVDTELETKVTK